MQNKYVFYTKKAQNLRFGLPFPLSVRRYNDISIFRLSFGVLAISLSLSGSNHRPEDGIRLCLVIPRNGYLARSGVLKTVVDKEREIGDNILRITDATE